MCSYSGSIHLVFKSDFHLICKKKKNKIFIHTRKGSKANKMYNDCSSLERLKPLLESFCDMFVMIKLTCVATDRYSCHHTIWCAFLFTAFRYSSSRMWRITENLFTKVLDYLCLFWNRQNFLCCQELQHIHTVVDPGFPRGDFANLLFSFLLKTARK